MISYLFQAIKELLDGCTDRPTDHDQLENTSNSSSRPTGTDSHSHSLQYTTSLQLGLA